MDGVGLPYRMMTLGLSPTMESGIGLADGNQQGMRDWKVVLLALVMVGRAGETASKFVEVEEEDGVVDNGCLLSPSRGGGADGKGDEKGVRFMCVSHTHIQ